MVCFVDNPSGQMADENTPILKRRYAPKRRVGAFIIQSVEPEGRLDLQPGTDALLAFGAVSFLDCLEGTAALAQFTETTRAYENQPVQLTVWNTETNEQRRVPFTPQTSDLVKTGLSVKWTVLGVPKDLVLQLRDQPDPVAISTQQPEQTSLPEPPPPLEGLFEFLDRRSVDFPAVKALYPALREQGIDTKQLFAQLTSEDFVELEPKTLGERKALAALVAELNSNPSNAQPQSESRLPGQVAYQTAPSQPQTSIALPAQKPEGCSSYAKRMAATVAIMIIGAVLMIVAWVESPTPTKLSETECQSLANATGSPTCIIWFWVFVGGGVIAGAGLLALLAILFRCSRRSPEPQYQVISQQIQAQAPYQAV